VPRVVLIDVTPLRTQSGQSGIGHYTFDLLCGLQEIRDEWKQSLDLVALTELRQFGRHSTTRDLRAAAEETIAARGTQPGSRLARRRFWLEVACRANRADLLHLTEAWGTPLLSGTPRLVTCYDVIPLVLRADYLGRGVVGAWRYANRLVRDTVRYRTAERLVAISERSRQDVIRVIGVDPSRVETVQTGIDLSRFSNEADPECQTATLRSLGLGARPFALYVGSGDPRKNAEGMFAALARTRSVVDVELAWAGGLSRAEKRRALEAARRRGVEGSVRWLGFVPDELLPALYRTACCHLFLSRLEGFGLTVVEAMASGCPVVVARGSGADDLSADAGMTVDPDDAESAGSFVAALAQDAALRAEWAEKGRARVPLFKRTNMARGYVAAYLRALGAEGPSREPAGSA